MGDRCYMQITVRREHLHHFDALGFVVLDDDPAKPYVILMDEEANYGHTGDLQALAHQEHLPFFGWHGEGEDYGGANIASDGQSYTESAIDHDGGLMCGVDWDTGEASQKDLAHIRQHIANANQAMKLCGFIIVARNAGKCIYPHHETCGQEITCPKCGGPICCAPFNHACPKCEPSQFQPCGICGTARYACTC